MRRVSAAVLAAMRSRTARLALMADIDHPDGRLRVWTGIGTLSYGGHEWTGLGGLATVKGVQSSSDPQIVDHTYVITNVGPDAEAFINAKVRGRRATTWLVFLDEANAVIPDPLQIAASTLDVTTYAVDESGKATLSLIGQSDLWQLEQPLNVSLTNTEQRKRYPEDSGFSEVVIIPNQTLKWTRV